jgi:hypothetical protein
MKKILLILAIALTGCTAEERSCNCKVYDFGTINGAYPWKLEIYDYSEDCADHGTVIFHDTEWQGGNLYDVVRKVECN